MRRYSERLLGNAVFWAVVWMGIAALLAGSTAFGMILPLLTIGAGGSLIFAALPEDHPKSDGSVTRTARS